MDAEVTKEDYEQRTGLTVTDQQWRAWLNDLRGAAQGNPFATLCRHCDVRHGPPRDDFCPRRTADVGPTPKAEAQ
jgi:hypothetical protein